MFHFYRVIFILVLFYSVPIYSADECADLSNCTLKDGRHTVGSKSTDPPRMEFKTTSVVVTLKTTIGIQCQLCQSNPASTIEWFFNGKPLIFKGERMHITSTDCQETLFLLTPMNEDEGNYTCVARNKFGEANSTTELKILGTGCLTDCILTDDGRHQVGTRLAGPPKLKGERITLNFITNDMVKISCQFCESNPPSKVTWFFNGIQLDLNKNNIQVISGGCEESLYFRVLKNQAGKYTCMAKNDLGQANFTTTLNVWDSKIKRPLITVKLEARTGTIQGNAVKIGSQLNITCTILDTPNCAKLIWLWTKNDELITKNETQYIHENGTNPCTRKLVISKVMTANTGNYQCRAMGWSMLYSKARSDNQISISAVSCFRGFYCPPNVHKAIRCPSGRFSMQQNAINVTQCQSCPTNTRNKTLMAFNPEAASIFKINCPYSTAPEMSNNNSGFSHGQIVSIALPLAGLVIVVMLAILYARRKDYKKMTHRPLEDLQIEIPNFPQSADVFVCYSSKNREWVQNTLFSNLRAQHFETFIDFIDFEIGIPIHQNIVNGIYGSRKTIFVLSKDSLRSYYARTELSQALVARRQTGHQVIVILYEKCKVPEEISNIVYLDWTDTEKRDQFWEKLYDAVRKPLDNETMA